MALALLAGSFPVAAQFCTVNGEVPYRTRLVKAAELDATFQDVKEINENYYYQLQVDPKSFGKTAAATSGKTYVLSAERDYSTGKIYLTAQPVTDATLTHSLWKIEVVDRSANGRVYAYINKETGYKLTFDHTNALQRVNKKYVVPTTYDENDVNKANFDWSYEYNGLTDGCIDHWAWYTTDDDVYTMKFKKIYSYFHNQTDSVIALKAILNGEALTANGRELKNLASITLDGDEAFKVIPVKDSKANASDFLNNMAGMIAIKPVVAGAKVLNAAEINSMIDADGSFLTFGKNNSEYIKNYDEWLDADNKDKAGEFAKFTVLDPETKEPLDIVDGTNPFTHTFSKGEFIAQTLDYKELNRTSGKSYAGYDVLLRTKDPKKQVGGEKQYGYLYVSEHNYEKTPTGNYSGLRVEIQPYAQLGTKLGTENATKKVLLEAAKKTAAAVLPDALEARYHWKVTYYATNDSLVLEPLNASRMNTAEMEARTPFEKTLAADAKNWVNTVNAAVIYSSGKEDGTWMSNKYKGVPVALYAMNNSFVGDDAKLLTIGTPSNAEAFDSKYAAKKKTQTGNPAYVTNDYNADPKLSGKNAYQADMELRLKFDHDYRSLTRATMASGVYFMNLATNKYSTAQTEHRVNGANLVADMGGHVVYDVEEQGQQDFNHMPATQWVVEQQPCLEGDDVNANENPTVRIYNREYGYQGSVPFFAGQLYTVGDGKLQSIIVIMLG